MNHIKKLQIALLALFMLAGSAVAQDFAFYPNASYNPAIPTLEGTVGHSWGEKITGHSEVERYLKALAAASPHVSLATYGKTWEGRTLYYLIVASKENMARVEEIRQGIKKLADPRKISGDEAGKLIKELPAITWLAYGVHGDEISSTDAAILTAYHLAAAQNDTLASLILKNSVVLIDPMQNPDGRDRFVHFFRQTRGRWADGNQQAAEHRQNWPGGRTNHYFFDMNRDWFAKTQPETQGKIKAYLEWNPQVYVDLHEMGSNSSYYFAPPADPLNPEIPESQVDMLKKFGRNNARWFDRMQFDYFTREVFDAFYPGYGDGWPMYHGSIGMTYEQASTRGLVVHRDDNTTMHYRETVQHHFIASLSTAENAARNKEDLLQYYYEYRLSAIEEGKNESTREFIIPPGRDPNRAIKLANLLLQQGIEVKRAGSAFQNNKAKDYYDDDDIANRNFPAGTFIVSLDQPLKRLVKNLLTKHIDMDQTFVKEQLRRQKKRMGHQIYDVTGWSLPLLYDVECYMAQVASQGDFDVVKTPIKPVGTMRGGKATIAWIVKWGTNSAGRALAAMIREKIRVFVADKSFTIGGEKYAPGALIIKTKNNPADLEQKLTKIANEHGITITATSTSWVTDGINFGSGNVQFIKTPKVLMAYNQPVSSASVGATRFILEQMYGYPVTIMHANQIGGADLTKFNVLILPNVRGSYSGVIKGSGIARVKDWIRSGGTLVTLGGATNWLTTKDVGLLATNRELKGGKPDKKDAKKDKKKGDPKKPDLSKPFDVEKEIQPEKEYPTGISGALMRVKLDTEHWLGFGYDGDANVMVSSGTIFTPIKLDKGRNVGLYMPEGKLMLSGFAWEETRKQFANKAYLMHQRYGRGNVVAFSEDPTIRAFVDGLNLLLLNAVFFGPSH